MKPNLYGLIATFATTCVLLGGLLLINNNNSNDFELVNTRLNSIEGRIQLHDGKATLTAGSTCIIHEAALLDEELAIQLTRACVQANSN